MKLMIDTIKEAIDIYSAESPQVNLDAPASRESLAEFIDKYILDEFEALLLDAFGVLNTGATLIPGIVKTLNIAREKNITLLVVTNGASNNSYKKREQLSRRRTRY